MSYKMHILVCGGTGCRASASQHIMTRLEECLRGLNDTDVRLLLADNYAHLREWELAERHCRRASRMCC